MLRFAFLVPLILFLSACMQDMNILPSETLGVSERTLVKTTFNHMPAQTLNVAQVEHVVSKAVPHDLARLFDQSPSEMMDDYLTHRFDSEPAQENESFAEAITPRLMINVDVVPINIERETIAESWKFVDTVKTTLTLSYHIRLTYYGPDGAFTRESSLKVSKAASFTNNTSPAERDEILRLLAETTIYDVDKPLREQISLLLK
jgi:hypothetical protein